tara:strand:- start:7634 stop:8128 length:495 start_codon:yes stop_codon:yes gene_type:complete
MAILFKHFKLRVMELIPLILLFFISLNGSSVLNIEFFSVNVLYILVYFWILRQPHILGVGYIFLAGIITDVVFGLPMGASSLSLLVIAGVAAYVRTVTVRITLINDWISFIPALLLANFCYFIALYFSNYQIEYLYLFKISIFTFVFYPILWGIFSIILKFMRS